ncbi:MAG: phage head completion protein [Cetobacterium sp.]|uniref:phage head completion protein n=1 Tax=Cetobacterium sp. TaxID=2071632 RepID=UPI003F326A64
MSNLASRLKNRIEIYEKRKVAGKLGTTYEDVLIKKFWGEIKFQSGSTISGEGDTEANNTRFKIRIRKTDISSENHTIVFRGLRFEIEYIYPDFKKNGFIDLLVKLKTE